MEISFTDAELQDLGINIQPSLDDSRNDDQFEAYQKLRVTGPLRGYYRKKKG